MEIGYADRREQEMPMSISTNDKRPAGQEIQGFTILELMVVIGILVILIGILLPAVRGVQRAAKNATTTNLINTLAAAIDQYHSVQRDWPGPFGSPPVYAEDIDRTDTSVAWNAITNPDGSTGGEFSERPTHSEELLLCLSGGMNIAWQSSATGFKVKASSFIYNYEDLDRGHVSLSSKNRGRLKPFMPAGTTRSDAKAAGAQFANDTVIPEYLDAYGTPILYIRAIKGLSLIDDKSAGTIRRTAYYNYNTTDTVIAGGALQLEAERYVEPAFIQFDRSYCEHPSLPNQVVNQDKYILVSAGSDKKFGTADDITNFDRKSK